MTIQWDENLTPRERVHKHTTSPTPWEACGGVVRDADSIGVCTCDWLIKDRAGANAALIARAVNCHEALLEALEALTDASYLTQPTACVLERQAAEAAIAKARGERR